MNKEQRLNTLYKKLDACISEYSKDGLITIFGAGQQAEELIDYSKLNIHPYIYDNDKRKAGKVIKNYEIKSAEDIIFDIRKTDWILVVSNYVEDIFLQLEQLGYTNLLSFKRLKSLCEVDYSIENRYVAICMLEATNYCNAKCNFCINPSMKREKEHMSQETFNMVLERLNQENIIPEMFKLHCSGEPLLDPNLFVKIKKIKNAFPDSKVGYTTNFSIATEDIIERIIEGRQDFITISLNAIDPIAYKNIMGLNFEKTISNINKLLQRKNETNSPINVVISAVADKNETRFIEQFKDMWKTKDVAVRIMKKGDWVDKDNLNAAVNNGERYAKSVCRGLYQEVFVLSNGQYGICCFDGEGSLGDLNIYNTSISEYMESKNSLRDMFIRGDIPEMCRNCSLLC